MSAACQFQRPPHTGVSAGSPQESGTHPSPPIEQPWPLPGHIIHIVKGSWRRKHQRTRTALRRPPQSFQLSIHRKHQRLQQTHSACQIPNSRTQSEHLSYPPFVLILPRLSFAFRMRHGKQDNACWFLVVYSKFIAVYSPVQKHFFFSLCTYSYCESKLLGCIGGCLSKGFGGKPVLTEDGSTAAGDCQRQDILDSYIYSPDEPSRHKPTTSSSQLFNVL